MLDRRSVLFCVAVVPIVTSCVLFRPVNPNPQPPRVITIDAPTEQPADTLAAQPAAQPAARPAAQPATLLVDPGSVNDAKIAAIVLASNNTDISYARLVPQRASRTDVKEFARRMLTDHTSINALVNEVLTKLDITPEDNVTSLDLRDESSERREVMRELSGYAFDSTYMENEISYHRKFLYAIDNILEPRARNSEIKTLIISVRPVVAAHLAHAEQVRANVLTRK